MPIAFSRSMRSLHADGRSRRAIWFLLIPAAVLAAWTSWFLGAHVSRYEVSDRARIEMDRPVHLFQAPIAGRIISSGLVMGREVHAGDLVLELDAGRILAPIAGKLSDVSTLRVGETVAEGDKLCTIIPSGEPRVIAEFAPPAALRRIRTGQHANVRIEGFGSIPAHVTSVGSEIRDGTVRVELALHSSPASIRLQNGMPGTVEVEIEDVSPATLLLRAAGHGRTP